MRAVLAGRARELGELTAQTDTLTADVQAAINDRETLPQLFLKLVEATAPTNGAASLTIYSPDFRTLAWSDGPAEDLSADRLRGADALFVTEGTLGLRLVQTRALRVDGRLIGVVAAESLLSFSVGGSTEGHLAFPTPYGDVTLVLPSVSSAADNLARPHTFMISGEGGAPLVEVRYDPAVMASTRATFRLRAAAVSALPLLLVALFQAGPWLRRRRESRAPRPFFTWTCVIALWLIAGTLALLGLARAAGVGDLVRSPAWGLLALGLTAVGPVSWWLRPRPRRDASGAPLRFVLEQAAAGAIAAGALLALLWYLHWRPTVSASEPWQFSMFPLKISSGLGLCGLLLFAGAALWVAASSLAIAAERWRAAVVRQE